MCVCVILFRFFFVEKRLNAYNDDEEEEFSVFKIFFVLNNSRISFFIIIISLHHFVCVSLSLRIYISYI